MEKTLKDITEYVDFLRKEGYFVCFSCFSDIFGDYRDVLLEYEVHSFGVCAFMKSNPKTFKKCVRNKQALFEKRPRELYYSHCYAGVEEYVCPIMYEEKLLMCVHVSGYRGKLPRSKKLAERTEKYVGSKFSDFYTLLSANPPERAQIERIVSPFSYMISELYRKCCERKNEFSLQKDVFNKAITYIYNNYAYKITCADVADFVCYSEAHLRRIFYKECGKPIMEYINGVRLTQAEKMLAETKMSVTDIAFAVGFSDSNYFSCVFKKKYKLPPKAYRKNFFCK